MVWMDALQGKVVCDKSSNIDFIYLKTDLPPHRDKSRPKHKWMANHSENFSGTKRIFIIRI